MTKYRGKCSARPFGFGENGTDDATLCRLRAAYRSAKLHGGTEMTNNRVYYVALDQRFSYVRGLPAAYQKLADYFNHYLGCDMTADDIREARRKHNCGGLIKRVSKTEARSVGL